MKEYEGPFMLPSPDEISSITQNIFATVLGVDVLTCVTPLCENRSDPVTGCIQISGEWKGAVIMQTTERFATAAAAKMLDLDRTLVTADDRNDAIAELTNMVGGNIKSQVPGPSFLSLPSVTTGADFNFRLYGAKTVKDVSFECDCQPIRILMCECIDPNAVRE